MSTQDASCAPFAKNRSARITEHTQRWDPILVFVRHNFIFYVGIMTTLFMFVFFSCCTNNFWLSPFWKKHFVIHAGSFHFWCSLSVWNVCHVVAIWTSQLSLCRELKRMDIKCCKWRWTDLSFASFLCFQNPNQKPVILRKRRQRIKIEVNWELFYYRSTFFSQPFSS